MENNILIYIACYWFSSVISSFIGLAVDRLPHQMKWRDDAIPDLSVCSPPSRCDHCHARIKWYNLIPFFGYFFSRGKCRNCGMKIPIIYPLTELIGGAGSVVLIMIYGIDSKGLILVALYLVLIFLTLIDIKETWLPFVVTIPLFWCGLLFSPFEPDAYSRILGACFGFLLFWLSMALVSYISKEDLVAGGDIVFSAAVGSWIGMERLPVFILFSSLLFIFYALPWRLKGIRCVPMGPAISVGFFICLL
ncbi:prepilin peptidase [Shigella dysenteriae]|jgi:leader peptidase (prepilin peptidase)/N-methyltransferase|nr:prepilin peptidase [Escherichia coli]EFP6926217.1 prepilin peptidase [Shigella dysenteriae]EJF5753050.1 prepilin peptidase [Shigella sonnei]EFO4700616.1 prepilin peptidase [Escherichia coli]EFP8427883.1 prepilin peptidase [Shigella dysenteriae]